jgi:integrase
MPLKLVPPRKGKTPFYYVRGSYLGIALDRSTKADKPRVARAILKRWRTAIERGEYREREDEPQQLAPAEPAKTFLGAAVSYMQAGGENTYVGRLLDHFKETPLGEIDQAAIDAAAIAIYPKATAATRNRSVYTPVSAVLKHAGVQFVLRRPTGAEGRKLVEWLWPDEAERLFKAAAEFDSGFALLLVLLCYTGMRLGEALRLTARDIRLRENFAYARDTKNGDPRPVFLPAHVVAMLRPHLKALPHEQARVFRFHKGGHIYSLLRAAAAKAEVDLPERQAFHIFSHTWATWMRRFAGLDTKGLVATQRWKDRKSADRYEHVVVAEESRKAAMLPVPKAWSRRGKRRLKVVNR